MDQYDEENGTEDCHQPGSVLDDMDYDPSKPLAYMTSESGIIKIELPQPDDSQLTKMANKR